MKDAMRLLAVTVAAGLAWEQAPPPPPPSLPQFVAALQQAVSHGDRQAAARLMRYPLDVRAGGLQIPVADTAAFVSLYDTIMTSRLKSVIARARVPAPGRLLPGVVTADDGGIVFEGAVTIAPSGGGYRVTALSIPLGARAAPPGEPIERHLTFRVGRPTEVSGSLEPGEADRYMFYAVRGAFVDARLSGVAGRTVLLRLLDASTGQPVDARAAAGVRVWSGRVSGDGQYRIEVARQPDTGREPLIYTLSVTLK